jgi:phage recombination protein Bet
MKGSPSMSLPLRLAEFRDDTPVAFDTGEGSFEMSVRDVLNWVAPGAPRPEAIKFLLQCKGFGLNPFLGEIYLINASDKWTVIIAKAGYLKRAQQHPDYNGHDAGIVVQHDKSGKIEEMPGTVRPKGWLLIGGWARVWRRGVDHPIKVVVGLDEYDRGKGSWRSHPCEMIRKVALVHAIREAFSIGDAYDAAEFDPEDHRIAEARVKDAGRGHLARTAARAAVGGQGLPAPAGTDGHTAVNVIDADLDESPTEDPAGVLTVDHESVIALFNELGATAYQRQTMLTKRGVSAVAELSPTDARELAGRLRGRLEQSRLGENLATMVADAPRRDAPNVVRQIEELTSKPEATRPEAIRPEATEPSQESESTHAQLQEVK